MDADIAQMKLLLWLILGLLVFFVAGNTLCLIFKCGQSRSDKFADLWEKGRIDELLVKTRLRLQEYPNDFSALYYGGKALAATGLHDSARANYERLLLTEPTLREACKIELDALDKIASGT